MAIHLNFYMVYRKLYMKFVNFVDRAAWRQKDEMEKSILILKDLLRIFLSLNFLKKLWRSNEQIKTLKFPQVLEK